MGGGNTDFFGWLIIWGGGGGGGGGGHQHFDQVSTKMTLVNHAFGPRDILLMCNQRFRVSS